MNISFRHWRVCLVLPVKGSCLYIKVLSIPFVLFAQTTMHLFLKGFRPQIVSWKSFLAVANKNHFLQSTNAHNDVFCRLQISELTRLTVFQWPRFRIVFYLL